MKVSCDRRSLFLRANLALVGVLMFVVFVISANAQTQASCQFTTFNTHFFISASSGYRTLVPRGVNDYRTVAGHAQDDGDFSVRGFTRFSGGNISYYRHNSSDTFFTDRTNSGMTVGTAGGQFALGSMNGTPFALQGSTFTPLTMTIAGKTYSKFTVWGTNRYGTTVGSYADASGNRARIQALQ